MNTIHAFIIDRDETIRNMLMDLVGGVDGLTASGSFNMDPNEDIISMIDEMNADIILLGIENTESIEMHLFELLRSSFPQLPIIVLPGLDRQGAEVAMATLKKGAVEYVTKTRDRTGSPQTKDHFMERLIPVIKAVPRLNRSVIASGKEVDTALADIERVSSAYLEEPGNPINLLVIVGCLGGVPALYLLLSSLPENLPVPVMVVQHMPKLYTSVLAEDLRKATNFDIEEAGEGTVLNAGRGYIAPGGYHAVLKADHDRNFISLNKGPKVKGFRPSIDVLLKSARNVYGKNVLVAYLSSGGNDGVEGAEIIDIAGGQIVMQNKHSSLLWDLPLKINIRGIDEGEYPLERLGHEITRRLG